MSEIDLRQSQNSKYLIEETPQADKLCKWALEECRYAEPSYVVVPTPSGAVTFGQNHSIVIVAGPYSVGNEEIILETAQVIKAAGAQFLYGSAYKPHTLPYTFQGLDESALNWLVLAREATGLGIITEVMDVADWEKIASVADVLQIDSHNMQNFSLLYKVGSTGKPLLLKRGSIATIKEWLMAAEYILAMGNANVILCEQGIRTFDQQYTRNTLDLAAIPVLRTLTHLPIMVDPSSSTGRAEYVPAMSKAAIASGADSLIIDVYPKTAKSLLNSPQSLTLERSQELIQEISVMSKAIGR